MAMRFQPSSMQLPIPGVVSARITPQPLGERGMPGNQRHYDDDHTVTHPQSFNMKRTGAHSKRKAAKIQQCW